MTKIFAFSGPPGSGKSTFCKWLNEAHGYRILNFADPLKKAARALWDLSDEQLNGPLKEFPDLRWGVTPRTIMQHLGTEHGRHICPTLHVRRMLDRIDKSFRPGYCVGDVRFENEVKALKRLGATLIYLTNWTEHQVEGLKDHPSENGLPLESFDLVVKNRRGQSYERSWVFFGKEWAP